MTCTKCRNVQCYICHKSCEYSHFDDKRRGGKEGNCPLFDNLEARHDAEVRAAEEKARQELTEKDPNLIKDLPSLAGPKPAVAGEASQPRPNPNPAPVVVEPAPFPPDFLLAANQYRPGPAPAAVVPGYRPELVNS